MMKSLRKKINLTQKELSEMLGVKQSTVSLWESGKSTPSLKMLKKLAIILQTSESELLNYITKKYL